MLPGAGVWRKASDREPERVLEDVILGKVDRDHARTAYGVVISGEPPRVDAEATRKVRAS